MIRFGRWATAVGALVLAACSADKPKPLPLDPLTPKIVGRVAWNASVGGVDFPLAVAVSGNVFTAAGSDGTVVAIDSATGREVWRASAGAKLSAGVGSDGRFAAVVTRRRRTRDLRPGSAEVAQAPGRARHDRAAGRRRARLRDGRRPRGAGLRCDRRPQALDLAARPTTPLALAQNSVLAAFKDTLVVGQGPRMAGVDPTRGTVRWEVPVGSPRGANEIERLADLVGPVSRIGDVICARSFQAAVGCVDAARGTVVWSRNVGGLDAIAADPEFVFAADATDRMTAWKTPNGEVAWTSDKLQYRGLSAPISIGKTVVYGDQDGTVHWLARETGEAQLRLPTDGSAIVAAPVAVGSTMLVVTRKGGLFAFRPQ